MCVSSCAVLSVSIHAETLTSSVLQCVVDLLWTRLNSMSDLVMTGMESDVSSDSASSPGMEDSVKTLSAEAQTQRELLLFLFGAQAQP